MGRLLSDGQLYHPNPTLRYWFQAGDMQFLMTAHAREWIHNLSCGSQVQL